jgi:hypothetical protein
MHRLTGLTLGLLLACTFGLAQSGTDTLIQATKDWLKNSSLGAREELNASMDARSLITTPAGDVLSKERLVPSDASQPVQKLPTMDLDGPIARVFGETGVVMSRLKPSEGPALNATFVFVNRQGAWKLVAVQLSPR